MSLCSVKKQNHYKFSPLNFSNLWLKNEKVLDHVVYATLRRFSLSNKHPPSLPPHLDDVTVASSPPQPPTNSNKILAFDFPQIVVSDDFTPLIFGEILLHILSKLLNFYYMIVCSFEILTLYMLFYFIELCSPIPVIKFSFLISHAFGSLQIAQELFLCHDYCL